MRLNLHLLAVCILLGTLASTASAATIDTFSFNGDVYQGAFPVYNGIQGTMTVLLPGGQLLENGNEVLSYDFSVTVFTGTQHLTGSNVPFDPEYTYITYPTVDVIFFQPNSLVELALFYSSPWLVAGDNWWFNFDGPVGDSGYNTALNANLVSSVVVPEPSNLLLSVTAFLALAAWFRQGKATR